VSGNHDESEDFFTRQRPPHLRTLRCLGLGKGDFPGTRAPCIGPQWRLKLRRMALTHLQDFGLTKLKCDKH
jgi:hypothetical protein